LASTTTERPAPKRPLTEAPPDAEPWRVTQRLTLRVGVLGVLVLVVFAALFLRLWALQVLAGTKYVDQASSNSYRTVRVQAPRGPIVDRNGRRLVINAAATSVQLWPSDLPKVYNDRYSELRRLARLARVPLYEIAAGIKARRGDPLGRSGDRPSAAGAGRRQSAHRPARRNFGHAHCRLRGEGDRGAREGPHLPRQSAR